MLMKALSTIICAAGLAFGVAVAQQPGQQPGPEAARQSVTQAITQGTVVDFPASPAGAKPPASRAAVDRLPERGMDKQAVLDAFGAPGQRHAPVGDPPITRWDYPDFQVFFEYDLVLHAVVPGDFPTIHHRDQLASGR